MPRFTLSRVLPYRREVLFALVADVESYPDFVPGWIAATIVRRQGDIYSTDQTVRFGPFAERFTTKTVLSPPAEILVTAIDGPLERLVLAWRFRALAERGCELTLDADLQLRSAILEALSRQRLGDGLAAVFAAFEDRARHLYGPPASLETDQGEASSTDVPGSAGAATRTAASAK